LQTASELCDFLLSLSHINLRKSSIQRNFEDRLGQRIEKLDESQKYRTEKMDATLQHVQTDIHCIASRLLNIAVSMQRLEDKLNQICEERTSDKHQQGPQKSEGTKTENSLHGSTRWMGNQHAEGNDAGYGTLIRRTQQDARVPGTPEHGVDGTSCQKNLDASISVENFEDAESDIAQSYEIVSKQDKVDCINPASQPVETETLFEMDTRFGMINMKLEQISTYLGVNSSVKEGDDEEDRRRLKEKLKAAIEVDRRNRVLTIVSRSEVWLEYIFGICSPDQRIGKSGSRCQVPSGSWCLNFEKEIYSALIYCVLIYSRLIHPRSRFSSGNLFF
jgi:hypothetical protein